MQGALNKVAVRLHQLRLQRHYQLHGVTAEQVAIARAPPRLPIALRAAEGGVAPPTLALGCAVLAPLLALALGSGAGGAAAGGGGSSSSSGAGSGGSGAGGGGGFAFLVAAHVRGLL